MPFAEMVHSQCSHRSSSQSRDPSHPKGNGFQDFVSGKRHICNPSIGVFIDLNTPTGENIWHKTRQYLGSLTL